MDFQKKISDAKYKIGRGIQKYEDAEQVEAKEYGIKVFEDGFKQLKMILQANPPPFLRNNLMQMIQVNEKKLENMVENKGRVAQATPSGGGGKKKDDDDKMNKNISDAIVAVKPNVKWSDIGGLENAKIALKEAVIMPIQYPNFFKGIAKPWKGILLYGPPGTGKTFLAKACATECDSTFFAVQSQDLIQKFVGESEKMIRALFEAARKCESAIVFIDEIDSLCSARSENESESTRRVKTEFLVQMDGVGNEGGRILVLGATNIPWGLDQAIRRRFEKRIYISLPDFEARRYLIEHKLKGVPCNISPQEYDEIAHKIDGFSGSDIEVLAKDAAMEPLRFAQKTDKFQMVMQNGTQMYLPVDPRTPVGGNVVQNNLYTLPDNSLLLPPITKNDVLISTKRSKASVCQDDLDEFIDWTSKFGEDGC